MASWQAILRHLICIARKLALGKPIQFHIDHIRREFSKKP